MRRLMWFTIGFAAASFAGATLYGSWLLLGAVAALLLAGLFAVLRRKHMWCRVSLLIALGVGIGLGWFALYDHLFVLIPRVADGQTISVSVTASDYSYETDYGSAVNGAVPLNNAEYRVKVYLHTRDEITPGDTVTGTFRFRLTTDGGKEDPTSHRSDGIFLLAYPVGSVRIEKCEKVSLRYYPAIWRQKLLELIREMSDDEAGSFASALLLGDRSGVTYEMNTSFKISGISHIIAVSGLHVSILFGLLYNLLARRRVLSCIVGIPALFFFAAIVGFTPSVTRACIMQSLMLIAMMTEREYDPPTSLAFAVLLMLTVNPLTVLSISFQLSVGCMVGIFLFQEKIRLWMLKPLKRIKGKLLTRLWQGIASSVAVSLSASVITTPFVAYYFGCVSLVGVITNVLIVWVVSFIFYGIILCLAMSLISTWIAGILFRIVSIPIYFVLYTASCLSKLPMAAVYTSNIYVFVWLCDAYVLLAIFLLQKKKQPILLGSCIALILLLSQIFSWLEPLQDDFRVTMLDVGQGQSILLQSDGKTFLVDCGGDDGEEAADITAEALLSRGISRLDGIIVTHYDTDHVGGLKYLMSRIRADRLILPYAEDEKGVAKALTAAATGVVEYVQDDLLYAFGSTKMTLFAPLSYYSDNESSICILFQREDCGILITGDLGELGEKVLLRNYSIPEIQLLVAGHHGSAGSTSMALLEATSPEIVLISVGENNRYGHPSDKVLERLKEVGCEIYRTDIHGTIIFRG